MCQFIPLKTTHESCVMKLFKLKLLESSTKSLHQMQWNNGIEFLQTFTRNSATTLSLMHFQIEISPKFLIYESEIQFLKNFENKIQISDPLFVLMVGMSRDRLETLPAIIVNAINSDSGVIKFPLPKEILLMKSGIIKSIFE